MKKLYRAFLQLNELREQIDIIVAAARLIGYEVEDLSSHVVITSKDHPNVTTLSPHELTHKEKSSGRKEHIFTEKSSHKEKLEKLTNYLQSL